MDQLEGSTLDLIHRRRIRSSAPGYVVIMMVVGMSAGLFLVRVDIVSTSPGMIRPRDEPVSIISPFSGMVDSTILRDHLVVSPGDTLIWICRDIPETRLRECRERIRENLDPMDDIAAILRGKLPSLTTRYVQSHRNHHAEIKHTQLQKERLEREFLAAEKLYRQEVIPRLEFEQARSDYMIACATLTGQREDYRSTLENELYQLRTENRNLRGEMAEITSTLHRFFVVSPAAGILRQCPGITRGFVLQAGSALGSVSPAGQLVAECYVETRYISNISSGTRVMLRFDVPGYRMGSRMETMITQIDPDVVVMGGSPVYRIRCDLEDHTLRYGTEQAGQLLLGMTFSASMVLDRQSLASLLVEKVERWANPTLSDRKYQPGNEKGS